MVIRCKHFQYCSAVFCPELSTSELTKGVWFIGEPICFRSDYADIDYVRVQKRLNKRQPSYLQGKALSVFDLIAMHREPRVISEEAKRELLARLKKDHAGGEV